MLVKIHQHATCWRVRRLFCADRRVRGDGNFVTADASQANKRLLAHQMVLLIIVLRMLGAARCRVTIQVGPRVMLAAQLELACNYLLMLVT
jgi:hypothetical protein